MRELYGGSLPPSCSKSITFWDAPAWTMLVPKMNGLQGGRRTAFWDSYNHGYKNGLPCSASRDNTITATFSPLSVAFKGPGRLLRGVLSSRLAG